MSTSADRGPLRRKILRALAGRPHRFVRLRRVTIAFSLAVLAALPLAHVARFDLWSGAHYAVGRRVDPITGGMAMVLAILGFYLATFVINALLGRVFCGFGCPVGEAARLGEAAAVADGKQRRRAWLKELGYDALLAAIALAWFVSPRVLWAGSTRARVTTATAWLLVAGALWLHGRLWRWSFCRRVCPIGLYYSVVQTRHAFGVRFDEALGTCTDCEACTRVCPVALEPRHLERTVDDIGGLAIDGLPARHHCLACGDCVRACELVLKRVPRDRIPLRLGFDRRRENAAPATSEAQEVRRR